MNNSSTKSIVAISLFIGLFAGCFWVFVYLAGSVKSGLVEMTATINGSNIGQQQNMDALRKEVRGSQEARALLQELSVKEGEIPQFLNALEALGSQHTPVVVSAVDINAEDSTLRVVLVFSGSLNETTNIFEKIIDVEYAAYVESYEVRIGTAEGNSNIRDWEASMRIELPFIAKEQ